MLDSEAYVSNRVRSIVLDFIVAEIKTRKCRGLHLAHATANYHCSIVTQIVASYVKLLQTATSGDPAQETRCSTQPAKIEHVR